MLSVERIVWQGQPLYALNLWFARPMACASHGLWTANFTSADAFSHGRGVCMQNCPRTPAAYVSLYITKPGIFVRSTPRGEAWLDQLVSSLIVMLPFVAGQISLRMWL